MARKKTNDLIWGIVFGIPATLLIIGGMVIMIYFNNNETIQQVVLEKSVADALNQKINENKEEFLICLKGKIQDGTAYIKELAEPSTMIEATKTSIQGRCPPSSIGTLHSHPNGMCSLSAQDAYSFALTRDKIIGIICKINSFGFFTPETLEKGVPLEVSS